MGRRQKSDSLGWCPPQSGKNKSGSFWTDGCGRAPPPPPRPTKTTAFFDQSSNCELFSNTLQLNLPPTGGSIVGGMVVVSKISTSNLELVCMQLFRGAIDDDLTVISDKWTDWSIYEEVVLLHA